MSEFEKSEKMEKEKIGKETVLVSPFGCRTGKNTYLRMLVFALFMLAAVGFLSSCATSGKSDAPEEEMTTTPPDAPEEEMTTTPPEPTEPTEPSLIDVERTTIADAIAAAMTAVAAVNDDSDDATVMAADMALAAAMSAVSGATLIPAGEVTAANAQIATISGQLASAKESRDTVIANAKEAERLRIEAEQRLVDQRQALSDTVAAARAAVNAVNDDSTDDEVTAADDAVAAALAAIAAATDVPTAETDAASTTVGDLQISLASAKSSRMAAINSGSQMEAARTAAETAAMDAMTAAANAKTSADNADAARENAATMQTGENSSGLAMKASAQADAAHSAYMDAKAASEAAAAATEVAAAVRAQADAENARDAAQEAETMAADYGQQSMDAAGMELKIDGTMKTIGGTTIDAAAKDSVVIIDGKEIDTGFQDNVETPGAATTGAVAVEPDPEADPDPIAYRGPTVGAAERSLNIGKTVDSSDDDVRLMIVTAYADETTVRVYAADETSDTTLSGPPGKITVSDSRDDGDGSTEDFSDDRDLRYHGTYYKSGTGATLIPGEANDVVADAKGKRVYSYVSADGDDDKVGTKDDTVLYVIVDRGEGPGESDIDERHYRNVVITVEFNTDGEADTDPVPVSVTAKLPVATDYDHIHFGVWADLDDDGETIDGLGIGFLQNYSGSGMTPIGGSREDMPNSGEATYNGNWVAAVQASEANGGGVTLDSNTATIKADFADADITVTLTDLAELTGDITGNSFKGTKDEEIFHTALDAGGSFVGSFSGGFYGTGAAEVGGIFNFNGGDDGAFVGAFGGAEE